MNLRVPHLARNHRSHREPPVVGSVVDWGGAGAHKTGTHRSMPHRGEGFGLKTAAGPEAAVADVLAGHGKPMQESLRYGNSLHCES